MNIIISTLLVSYLSLFFLLLLCLPQCSHSAKCNPQDKKALKQIEKELTIPPHFKTWNETDCCEWEGIDCDPETKRVTTLSIQEFAVVSGQIPDAVGDLPALQSLIIQNCRNLTGPLPKSLTKLTNLTLLFLSANGLSGPVPSFLAQLKNLDAISLPRNSFTGPIPSSFSKLPRLRVLSLEGNKITGSIPEFLWKLALPSYIFLGNNKLTGKVPRAFGNANFTYLDFSRNKLEGDISFLFGKNKVLNVGEFSRNMFEFDMSKVEFPETLRSLHLSHNKIYGSIPEQMTKLEIFELDLSYNKLCGKIPTGGKMQDYPQSAYLHNRCLCGAPLPACK